MTSMDALRRAGVVMTDVTVKLDMFPADALLADVGTTYQNSRVTVADDELIVWRHEAGGAVAVYRSPLVSWVGNVRTGYVFETDSGRVIAGKNGGCGCGAYLGQVDLFPGFRRVNTSL